MSQSYRPVLWNRSKYIYDAVLVAVVVTYLLIFLKVAPQFHDALRPVETPILRMRAFGSCAYLMLTFILCIGPLARLDRRFLPLLYNRRHFGVLTCIVAFIHATYVINWYYVFAPTDRYLALLTSNVSFGQLLGFPFEIFGIFALLILIVLAVTSHDFWLSFLTPRIWKILHMGIYAAYAALVAHVAFGYFQNTTNDVMAIIFLGGALVVAILHLVAGSRENKLDATSLVEAGCWFLSVQLLNFRTNGAVLLFCRTANAPPSFYTVVKSLHCPICVLTKMGRLGKGACCTVV